MIRGEKLVARLACDTRRLKPIDGIHYTLPGNRSARARTKVTDKEDVWERSCFDERDNPAKYACGAGNLDEDCTEFTPTQIFLLALHPSVEGSKAIDTEFGQREDQHALLDAFRQAHPEVWLAGDQS